MKKDRIFFIALLIFFIVFSSRNAIKNSKIWISLTEGKNYDIEEVKEIEKEEIEIKKEENKEKEAEKVAKNKTGTEKIINKINQRAITSGTLRTSIVLENDYDNNKRIERTFIQRINSEGNPVGNYLFEIKKDGGINAIEEDEKMLLEAKELSNNMTNKTLSEENGTRELYEIWGIKPYNGWYMSTISDPGVQRNQKSLIDSMQRLLEIPTEPVSKESLNIIENSMNNARNSIFEYYYKVGNLKNFLGEENKEGEMNRYDQEELDKISDLYEEYNREYIGKLERYIKDFETIENSVKLQSRNEINGKDNEVLLWELLAEDVLEVHRKDVSESLLSIDYEFSNAIKDLDKLNSEQTISLEINGEKPVIRRKKPEKIDNNDHNRYMYFIVNKEVIEKGK